MILLKLNAFFWSDFLGWIDQQKTPGLIMTLPHSCVTTGEYVQDPYHPCMANLPT